MGKRTGVISDIHGNSPALRAVLADVANMGCERLVVLGDIINGIDPQGCVDLLRNWGDILCIRGNAEAYLLTPDIEELPHEDLGWNLDLIQYVHWIKSQLSPSSLNWLADLPEIIIETDFCYVHDSPIDRTEPQRWHRPDLEFKYQEWYYHAKGISRNMSEELRDELLEYATKQNLTSIFCGHTHEPFQYEYHGRFIINAGSAGLPLDGDWKPSWVMIEMNNSLFSKTFTIRRVEYDLNRTLEMLDHSPDFPGFQKPEYVEAVKKMLVTGSFHSYY